MKKSNFLKKEIKMLKYVRDAGRDGRLSKDVRNIFGDDIVDEYLYYDFIQKAGTDSVIITISGNDKIKKYYESKITLAIGITTLIVTLVTFFHQLFVN